MANRDHMRAQKAGLSKRMKSEAEHRRCPKCHRGYATSSHPSYGMLITTCRYCDYERARFLW